VKELNSIDFFFFFYVFEVPVPDRADKCSLSFLPFFSLFHYTEIDPDISTPSPVI
jgi:hypothetical protein